MPIRGVPPVITPPPPQPLDAGEYRFQLERAGQPPYRLDDSNGIQVQLGAQGLDGTTFTFSETQPAGWDGTLPDQISADPLEVFLPLFVRAGTLLSLRQLKQRLAAYLNPRNGPVTLRVTLPDGTSRLIDGYYRPVAGSMDADSWWVSKQKYGIVLRCTFPFFRSDADWTVEWRQADDEATWLPMLPLAPGDSNALSATNEVEVDGDVETYPVWEITGPLESCEILDVGTGKSFLLTASIGEDETWVVDTRRGQQAVYDADGLRQRSKLNAGAVLWPLQPGVSNVQTIVTGASAGAKVTGRAPILWLAA
jgi:hypothetical protein